MNAPIAEQFVLTTRDPRGVATLTLNRPQQFNALSQEMMTALQSEFDALDRDESVRVVIIGAQGRAFCPGHDLKQMKANPTHRVLPPAVRAVHEADDDDSAFPSARDRTSAWHRNRGRLPAGGDVRPRGCGFRCEVRRIGHQRRLVLRDARRGIESQCRPQGGV